MTAHEAGTNAEIEDYNFRRWCADGAELRPKARLFPLAGPQPQPLCSSRGLISLVPALFPVPKEMPQLLNDQPIENLWNFRWKNTILLI